MKRCEGNMCRPVSLCTNTRGLVHASSTLKGQGQRRLITLKRSKGSITQQHNPSPTNLCLTIDCYTAPMFTVLTVLALPHYDTHVTERQSPNCHTWYLGQWQWHCLKYCRKRRKNVYWKVSWDLVFFGWPVRLRETLWDFEILWHFLRLVILSDTWDFLRLRWDFVILLCIYKESDILSFLAIPLSPSVPLHAAPLDLYFDLSYF